jgi:hypothetical protein
MCESSLIREEEIIIINEFALDYGTTHICLMSVERRVRLGEDNQKEIVTKLI